MRFVISRLLLCVCIALLAACSKDMQPDVYDTAEIGVVARVTKGVIISKNPVKITMSGEDSTINALPAANEFDKGVQFKKGFQYIIQLEDGQVISVVENENVSFKPKQKVLITFGKTTRISANEMD